MSQTFCFVAQPSSEDKILLCMPEVFIRIYCCIVVLQALCSHASLDADGTVDDAAVALLTAAIFCFDIHCLESIDGKGKLRYLIFWDLTLFKLLHITCPKQIIWFREVFDVPYAVMYWGIENRLCTGNCVCWVVLAVVVLKLDKWAVILCSEDKSYKRFIISVANSIGGNSLFYYTVVIPVVQFMHAPKCKARGKS